MFNHIFLEVLHEIITELGGRTFIPRNRDLFDFGVIFLNGNKTFFDNIEYKHFSREKECGVVLKSSITDKKFISIKTYTFLLVNEMEKFFGRPIKLTGITAKYYFLGELEISNTSIF